MAIKFQFPDLLTGTRPQVVHAVPTTPANRYVASVTGATLNAPVASVPSVGGAGALVATGSAMPLAKVDGTKQYLAFDGADDVLKVQGATRPKTIVAVARYRGQPASGSNWPIVRGLVSAGGTLFMLQRASNGSMVIGNNTALVTTLNPGTAWHVFVAVLDGANSLLRMDDNAEFTGNAGSTTGTLDMLELGGRGTTTGTFSQVDIAEVFTTSHVMTAQERADTVTRLRAVYGI